jgi:hypothetical protein
MALIMPPQRIENMKPTHLHTDLPVGPAVRIACQLDAARAACSKVARRLLSRDPVNEQELEECARLDEVMARVQKLLRATVRSIMLSRLKRGRYARHRGRG